MKKVAAIDIGTNTALLLIAEVTKQSELHPLVQKERIVRLGEAVDRTGLLKTEAMTRTLQAIEDYVKIASNLKTEIVLISGTSAVRDAENRDEFKRQIKARFGLDLQVLSGEEEAQLTYFGALTNKQDLKGEILLIDIGGGSTEIIVGKLESIEKTISLDIGSVRLTERLIKHDPITDSEFQAIQNLVQDEIIQFSHDWSIYPKHFVGVAGTATTLAAMHLGIVDYNSELIDYSVLNYLQIAEIIKQLKVKSLEDKKKIPGLKPERADVMLAGGLILFEIMKRFNYRQIIISDRGLRFGLILKYLKNTGTIQT